MTNSEAQNPADAVSAIDKFAIFMRFPAPPTPSPNLPGGSTSIARGKSLFSSIGCAACHWSGGTWNQDVSEANAVVSNFNQLSEQDKQNLLNFLRSL